jgi:hypothetical protein
MRDMKEAIVVIAFSFAAGFAAGAVCLMKTYIDMPSHGWWVVSKSTDGYTVLSNGNITIKTLEKIEDEESEINNER